MIWSSIFNKPSRLWCDILSVALMSYWNKRLGLLFSPGHLDLYSIRNHSGISLASCPYFIREKDRLRTRSRTSKGLTMGAFKYHSVDTILESWVGPKYWPLLGCPLWTIIFSARFLPTNSLSFIVIILPSCPQLSPWAPVCLQDEQWTRIAPCFWADSCWGGD